MRFNDGTAYRIGGDLLEFGDLLDRLQGTLRAEEPAALTESPADLRASWELKFSGNKLSSAVSERPVFIRILRN